jgi:D-glycero-D-manno-heptose 1,7-bisphosphate phosphatase
MSEVLPCLRVSDLPDSPWIRGAITVFVHRSGYRQGEARAQGTSFSFPSWSPALITAGDKTMNRAVFLDRDGTIIEDKHYLCRVEEVAIYPGAADALVRLQCEGFKLFIVSNQAGVGRGYFTMAEVEKVNAYLLQALGREGVHFEKVYIAPEAPGMPSRGRKPSPQFLLDARDEFGVDLARSYMIGDKLIDLECGWNAGARKCLLVRTGYGAELERTSADKLDRAAVVEDLPAAADWILGDQGSCVG